MPEGGCPRCGTSPGSGAAADQLCPVCLLALGLTRRLEWPASPGESLLDHLEIVNVIGDGPRGRVYLAEWTRPAGGYAAVKRLHSTGPPGMLTHDTVRRLLDLDHPHIATFFECGSDTEGHLYTVTDYVPGMPLTRFCRRRELPFSERIELVLQAADAMSYAHLMGVVHLNLTAPNLLVVEAPVGVKLVDFSLPGVLVAAVPAPDAARVDVNSLGTLLAEVLSDASPVSTGSRDRAGTDRRMAEAMRIPEKATAYDGSAGYRTVAEFAGDLARCLASAP